MPACAGGANLSRWYLSVSWSPNKQPPCLSSANEAASDRQKHQTTPKQTLKVKATNVLHTLVKTECLFLSLTAQLTPTSLFRIFWQKRQRIRDTNSSSKLQSLDLWITLQYICAHVLI